MLRALAIAAILVPATAHADCAMWGLAPKVLTPANGVVASDGGIVVAAVAESRGDLAPGDAAVQTGWRLRVGGSLVKPPIDKLAPGLAVYRAAVANSYKLELEDEKHAVVATVRPARDGGDALAAPKLRRVWFDKLTGKRGGTRVGVELDGGTPAHAIALVLADAQGTPRSWALVDGSPTLYPYVTGDCRALPNGTIPSKPGDKVTLYWIDDAGRKSPASKPIEIAP
jgi:hypothetical protein